MKISELKKIAEARTESEWYPDWWLTHPRTWRAVCVPTNNEIESRNNAQFISTFANHADALIKVVEAASCYVNEPKHNIEERDVILNRRHDNFRKLAFALKALEEI